MRVHSLGREDPLEESIATHSSILAWRILLTELPGRLRVKYILKRKGVKNTFKHSRSLRYYKFRCHEIKEK